MNGLSNSRPGERTRFRRRSTPRRFTRGNVRNAASTVRGIMQNRKAFKRLAAKLEYTIGEKKYLPINFGGFFAVSSSGTGPTNLSAVTQGDTDTTRDGDQITLRSLEFNWSAEISYVAASPDPSNKVRCVIFQWFPNSVPVVADVFLTTFATTAWTMTPYNHDKRFMFRILYDKVIQLNLTYTWNGASMIATPSDNTYSNIHRVRISKFPHRKVQMEGTTTVGTNHIYVTFLSDSSIVSHPEAVYISKLNYSDL